MTESLAQGRFLRLVRDADGWEWVERSNASAVVAIIAVTDDDHLIAVEQLRRPVGRRVLELPAGLAGDAAAYDGEPPIEAAKRELFEETGYAATQWTWLAEAPSSAGLTSETVHLFLARGLVAEGPGGGDEHEAIVHHRIPLDGAWAWLDAQRAAGLLVDHRLMLGVAWVAGPPDLRR